MAASTSQRTPALGLRCAGHRLPSSPSSILTTDRRALLRDDGHQGTPSVWSSPRQPESELVCTRVWWGRTSPHLVQGADGKCSVATFSGTDSYYMQTNGWFSGADRNAQQRAATARNQPTLLIENARRARHQTALRERTLRIDEQPACGRPAMKPDSKV